MNVARDSFHCDAVGNRGAAMLRLDGGNFGPVCIFGTHLSHHIDCSEPELRLNQMKAVLRYAHGILGDPEDDAYCPVLIAGDFNQQRQQDYSDDVWESITASMQNRGQPEDDGVSQLLQASGFTCCFDYPSARTNWPTSQNPPPTHWTSTIVDYTYGRGVEAQAVYVGHSSLSDHQPVVTDWITAEPMGSRGEKSPRCCRMDP